jgi:cytochrome c
MKIKFTALIVTVMITSNCLSINGAFAQTHKKTASKTKKTPAAKKPTVAELQLGQALLTKSDCLSCHKIDMKLVGPAYKDVSAKYPATEASYTMLTQKVISGGNGVWGQVAMAPHPTLAPADVKKMVEYILSIDKKP